MHFNIKNYLKSTRNQTISKSISPYRQKIKKLTPLLPTDTYEGVIAFDFSNTASSSA